MEACPYPQDPIYQYLQKKLGAVAAMEIFIKNKGLPDTKAEADQEIANYKGQELRNLSPNYQRDIVLEKLSYYTDKIIKEGELFFTNDEQKAEVARVSHLLEQHQMLQGREYKGVANRLYAKKGTIVHEYLRVLSESVFSNTSLLVGQAEKLVIERLKQHPDFKEDADPFFRVTPTQFNTLKKIVLQQKSEAEAIQKEINLQGEFKVFNEITLYDEFRTGGGVTGTLDTLIVYSDGSASVFDYKSSSSIKKGKGFSQAKKNDFAFQLGNYNSMLKNVYGVGAIRQSRIIPIRMDFSEKVGNDFVVNEEGFRSLSAYVNDEKMDWLKPLVFDEQTGDKGIDRFLQRLLINKSELIAKKESTKNVAESVRLSRQIASIEAVMQTVAIQSDVNQILSNLSQIIDRIKSQTTKSELTIQDLVDYANEVQVYTHLAGDFKDKLVSVKANKDEHKKLAKNIDFISGKVSELHSYLLDEIKIRLGGDSILDGGQGITDMGKLFSGIDNIEIPIFQQFAKLYTEADDASRIQTENDFRQIQKAHDALEAWSKNNGGINLAFEKLYDKATGKLHSQYISDFWEKYKTITTKHKEWVNKKGNKLTVEEQNWLRKHFKIDQKAVTKYEKEVKEGLKNQLDRKIITKEQYEDSLAGFYIFTDPNKGVNFFNGNKHNARFLVPSDAASKYFSSQFSTIVSTPELKQYYDMYTNFMAQYRDTFGASVITDDFVANVHKQFAESITENGFFDLQDKLRVWQQSLLKREQDELMGTVSSVDSNGEMVGAIPMLFLNSIKLPMSPTEKAKIEQEIADEMARSLDEIKTNAELKKQWEAEVNKRVKDKEYADGLSSKSGNLTRSLKLFVASANRHQQMSTIEPAVKGLYLLVQSDKIATKTLTASDKVAYNELTNKISTVFGLPGEQVALFKSFMDRLIYGKQYKKEAFKNTGKYSSNKIISQLTQFYSASAIAWHIPLTFANYITARNNVFMVGKENIFYTKKGLNKALTLFGKRDERFEAIVDYVQPSNRSKLQENADESGGFISKWVRSKSLYLGHILGDDRIDMALTVAMADHYVLDSDGKIKNPKLDEIIDKEAKTLLELVQRNEDGSTTIKGVIPSEYTAFRNKVRKLSNRTKGMADERQKGAIYNAMSTAQLMFLRGWMPGMATERFGILKYDSVLETFDEGRYKVALGEIFGRQALPMIKTLSRFIGEAILMGKYSGKLNTSIAKEKMKSFLNQNPEVRQRLYEKYAIYGAEANNKILEEFLQIHEGKMNAMAHEVRTYVLLAVALSILGSQGFDEEDEQDILSMFKNNGHEVLRRSLLELSFWTSPSSAGQIIRSPYALVSFLESTAKVIENDLIIEGSYALRGKRNPNDETFTGYYTLKQIPIVNKVMDLFGIFHPFNRPKSTIEKIFYSEDE